MRIYEIVPGMTMPLSSEERAALRLLKSEGMFPNPSIDKKPDEHLLHILDGMYRRGAIDRTVTKDGKEIFRLKE